MTDNFIKSRLKKSSIIWFLFMLLAGIAIVAMILQLPDKYETSHQSGIIVMGIFFGFLLILLLKFFNEYKLIKINRAKKTLIWYSPIFPLGRKIDLSKYIYKIIVKSAQGESVYLIDNSMITRIRIGGVFFKNFKELSSAIELKEIKDYELSIWRYLRLIYTGRIKIKLPPTDAHRPGRTL